MHPDTKSTACCSPAGSLAYDEAVLSYLQKLDEHRRKCESDGRYAEARAAALRLADLRTAQVGARDMGGARVELPCTSKPA